MSLQIDFCYDRLGSNPDLGYPNLAADNLKPDQFDTTWPRVLPLRLLMYLQQFGHRFRAHLTSQAPIGSWYPIALAWHDFDCDYFAMISDAAKNRARSREIKFLFYYHEGDHPGRIKSRFDQLCINHRLPIDCYILVSANSSAARQEGCYYFNDHEYFLSYINRAQQAFAVTNQARSYEFTALNRIHKKWRATVMCDLHQHGVLDRSLWSYNPQLIQDDTEDESPIRLDVLNDHDSILEKFLSQGPYFCDRDNDVQHNDHRHINHHLYTNSYCHLVIETFYDVDQSGGSFLTEKTYKCLKFGQPFVIIGAAGSLDLLRQAGYRVFDHAIDNRYDGIQDHTERWLATRRSIMEIQKQDMHRWYSSCLDDIKHNQWQYSTKSHGFLDQLLRVLTKDDHTI